MNVDTSLVGSAGVAIEHDNFELTQMNVYLVDTSEDFLTFSPTVYDLTSQASASGIAPKDWEASLDLSQCVLQSADDTYLNFLEPLFEGDDIIEYEIGSGEYLVPFTDWLVNGGTCTVNLVYDTRVFLNEVANT